MRFLLLSSSGTHWPLSCARVHGKISKLEAAYWLESSYSAIHKGPLKKKSSEDVMGGKNLLWPNVLLLLLLLSLLLVVVVVLVVSILLLILLLLRRSIKTNIASLHLTITLPHWVPAPHHLYTVRIHPTSVPGSTVPVQCHLHTRTDFGLISVEVKSILPY